MHIHQKSREIKAESELNRSAANSIVLRVSFHYWITGILNLLRTDYSFSQFNEPQDLFYSKQTGCKLIKSFKFQHFPMVDRWTNFALCLSQEKFSVQSWRHVKELFLFCLTFACLWVFQTPTISFKFILVCNYSLAKIASQLLVCLLINWIFYQL